MKYSVDKLKMNTHGAVFDTITKETFNHITAKIPPLRTQERIADILGSLDDKIELNRQMNQTLEAMARAIFKSWFVDFEPVYAKMEGREVPLPAEVMDLFPDDLVTSELGLIPRGWEIKPLDKIANYMNGYAMQKYPPGEGEDSFPVIKIRELRTGSVDNRSNRASLQIPEKYVVEDGDVLFSWSGSLLVTLWCGGTGALNQHLFKVTSADYPKWFYYLWTDYHLQEFQRIAADKATTMGHIKRSHLSQALCALPNNGILNYADSFLKPLIEKIIINSLESKTLENIRETLLPKMMSGDIEI
jgi:type I restriction enzyme S subunit